MARKLASTAEPAVVDEAKAADNPLEDLFTIAPDLPLTVDGRDLVVKEFRFFSQEQRALRVGHALIEDLRKLTDSGEAKDAGVETYIDLMAQHEDAVHQLMLDSIDGIDAKFIERLNPADGRLLYMTWWAVAGRFFWRTVVRRLLDRAEAKHRRKMSAGSTSFSPSLALPASIPATSMGATPGVN